MRGSGALIGRNEFASRRCAVLFLCLFATASCARYHTRPIVVEQSLEDFEARRLDAPELEAFLRDRSEVGTWPPLQWGLHDITLAAFYYSPALDVARAQWAVAEGGVLTAGGRPNPAVLMALGYNASTPADQVTPWIPEAGLALPLDVAGKRGIRVEAARHASEAARLNLLGAAWQVRSRVRRAFLSLYVARESAALLTRQQEIQGETIRILEARLDAGEVSPTEVTRARIDLADSRVSALLAAATEARARSEMADAIGVPPAALDEVELTFEELEGVGTTIPAGEVRRRALLSRSDILAALADYEASQSALQLEIRNQYPDITLGPGYQLDQTDSKWTLGLGLSLPFPNRNQGPIAETMARREEVGARFLALQSRVLGEVDASVVQAEAAVVELGAADTLLTALERQEATAQAAYDVGEISRLDLLALQLEISATGLLRMDVLASAQEALGALEDAMQAPLNVETWVLEAPERAAIPEDFPR